MAVAGVMLWNLLLRQKIPAYFCKCSLHVIQGNREGGGGGGEAGSEINFFRQVPTGD